MSCKILFLLLFALIIILFKVMPSSATNLEQFIDNMALEDKVGQLCIGFIHGEELDVKSKMFLHETKLGNVIYFNWANGLHSPSQVKKLSAARRDICFIEGQ